MQTFKKNKWSTLNGQTFANFTLEFTQYLDYDDHIGFVKDVMKLCSKYEIYKIDTLENDKYIDFLKYYWQFTDTTLPFFMSGYHSYSEQSRYPASKLAFYENGEIVEKYISEIGIRDFEPTYITFSEKYRRCFPEIINPKEEAFDLYPPISFSMTPLRKGVPSLSRLTGQINSNIWVDKVGLEVRDPETGIKKLQYFDNTELAMKNTPRLNSFLRGFRELAKKYDAIWKLESESDFFGATIHDDHAILIGGKLIYLEDVEEDHLISD